ncbi:MAG: phenylalanine--tRNA ligase subunit beta [Oscillospiraceae bacterium]|nr:phenylalanine--tRNA ligase subunit beta [Oscillospiraceae bacterium]
MILSMKWLSEFVKLDDSVTSRDYAEALTLSGSKVEGWEKEGEEISNVIVGKILSVEKHPDSDHLVICQLDVGKEEPVQIVTGASNVNAGDIVPVAMDKSTLPGGVKITKGKLRGVASNGMLCSLGELGLTSHDFPYAIEDGIFIMQEDCKIGQDIQSAIGLDDTKVEFEITPNRPDCLSVIGLARETAATFDKPLELHTPVVKGGAGNITDHLSVEVQNPELCPRYIARMAKNIKIGPSPRWMRERLRASGVRPINNIVDITNYVMLEYGQPMHAFDHKFVAGGKIVVRNAKDGESITTLEGVEHKLTPDMLAICDIEKPSAVAGVMGGEYSGINDETNMIVFESANFKGSSVRLTSKALGLRTESSARFEKGLDPQMCMAAVNRACELVELLGAGEVLDGCIDIDNTDHTPHTIPFTPDWMNGFLGIDIPAEQQAAYLEKLDIKVEGDKVIVPSFRADIEDKADVAEEVARMYGYDKIPVTTISGMARGGLTDRQKFDRLAEQTMLSCGLYEIYTYSFISPKYYDKINLPADSELRRSVTITNPLGEDTSVMRTTALPSMLEVLARNYNNRNASAALYEIATEYYPKSIDELPDEVPQIMMGMYGAKYDFYTLKGIVEILMDRLGIQNWDVEPQHDNPTFHPGRCADLLVDGKVVGVFGEIHPKVCQNYEIGTKTYVARINADLLYAAERPEVEYTPLPKFPASARDLAILCDDATPVRDLERAIRSASGKLLEKLELFDVYRGKQIEEGKKSVAYNLVLRAADRTLTVEEADNVVKKVLKALDAIGATLRS